MNQTTTKLIISSIALSLVLGSSSLYLDKKTAAAAPETGHEQAVHKQLNADGKRHLEKKAFPILEEAAAAIGVEKEALKQSLKEGKSLAEVARANGVSEDDLTAKLLKVRNEKIEQAVKDGKLAVDKADKMKQRMSEHLKFMIHEKQLLDQLEKHTKHHRHPDPDKMAKVIGISKAELEAQLKAGKSLTEIAAAKGISKKQLVEKIKEQMTPAIEKMVDRKKGEKNEAAN
jgi:uncharacterized protein YidB (DUF937 family)